MTLLHICDYGSGNIHNVERALVRAGAQVLRCESAQDMVGARAVVIPGVGAFGDCIAALRAKGFEEPIKDLVDSGVWVLGICVGMQILATHSEEFGHHQGMGIIPGSVRLIPGQTPEGNSETTTCRMVEPVLRRNQLVRQPVSQCRSGLTRLFRSFLPACAGRSSACARVFSVRRPPYRRGGSA